MSRTSSWEPSWRRLGGVLEESKGPTKLQVGVPNRRKIDKKSMQKSIKNSMPSKFQFWSNFDRFLEGKWRHVGTKIESKIDVNFERPILQKVLKNKWMFIDFYGFGGRSWHQNSIKIDQKLKPKMDCLLASIFDGFWWVLGAKLGGKIEPRAIENRLKNTSKMMRKRCVLEAPGWSPAMGALRRGLDPGTP